MANAENIDPAKTVEVKAEEEVSDLIKTPVGSTNPVPTSDQSSSSPTYSLEEVTKQCEAAPIELRPSCVDAWKDLFEKNGFKVNNQALVRLFRVFAMKADNMAKFIYNSQSEKTQGNIQPVLSRFKQKMKER